MKKLSRKIASVLIASLPFVAVACRTEINGRAPRDVSNSEYPNASIFAQDEINKKLSDVPYMRGKQVVDACASIIQIGPAAIPHLEPAAKDDNPMRRTFVMNVLGAIGDRRALKTLTRALDDQDPAVRYEAARSCVRLGDWSSGMPVLIAGLRDTSLFARTLCFDALRKQTNLDFGYQPKGADAERKTAAEKWEAWWESHNKATMAMRQNP